MLQLFNKSSKKGFTLIELLVVIAIIGILSSIVLVSLGSARKKARDARRQSDIKQIGLALELYYDAQSSPTYPTTVQTTSVLSPTYLAVVPTDPKTTIAYSYTSASASTYCLYAVLETTGTPSFYSSQNGTGLDAGVGVTPNKTDCNPAT